MEKNIYALVKEYFKGHGVDYTQEIPASDSNDDSFFFDSRDEAMEGIAEVLQAISDWGVDNFRVALESDSQNRMYVVTISEITD